MTCIICKGEGTRGTEQIRVCDNCNGSGEVGEKIE